MDEKEQMKFIADVAKIVTEVVVDTIRTKPYGIIHDSHPVSMLGKDGWLKWDFIIWNELTFEEIDTGNKHSLFQSISDKDTKERFDLLVEQYGK